MWWIRSLWVERVLGALFVFLFVERFGLELYSDTIESILTALISAGMSAHYSARAAHQLENEHLRKQFRRQGIVFSLLFGISLLSLIFPPGNEGLLGLFSSGGAP